MKIAVVVPFHAEPSAQLVQCIESVLAQTVPCDLVLVSDGAAVSLIESAVRSALGRVSSRLIFMPEAHADFGDCARAVGSLDAIVHGAEAVAFLDADNWWREDHLENLAALHERTGAPFCSSARWIARVDGSVMGPCGESDGVNFADTSTMLVTAPAFQLLPLWAFIPKALAPIGDRIFFGLVKAAGLQMAHSEERTLFYRSRYASHYRSRGEPLPPTAKEAPGFASEGAMQEFVFGVPSLHLRWKDPQK